MCLPQFPVEVNVCSTRLRDLADLNPHTRFEKLNLCPNVGDQGKFLDQRV